MKNCVLLLLITFCLACQSEPKAVEEEQVELEEILPGTWETIDIKVNINSAEGQADSSRIDHITEDQWTKRLGMQPIRTYFEPENKFRREHRTQADVLLEENRGIWNTFGDTLLMIEPDATYQYIVSFLDNGLMHHQSLTDWDGDGVKDDTYLGTLRKVSQSVN